MKNRLSFLFSLLVLMAVPVRSQTAPPESKGGWVTISDGIVEQLAQEGKKQPWPGLSTNVSVDPITGHIYVAMVGEGLWRSTDAGKTFARIDGGTISGRCETGWAIDVDPQDGQRLACFMLDGKGGLTLDGGKTWKPFTDVARNWDYGAVDWSVPEPKTILAVGHECGGKFYLSRDTGVTWTLLGTGTEQRYGDGSIGVGAVDAGTLLLHRAPGSGLERSIDDGKTWTHVSDLNPKSRVAVVRGNAICWVGKEGLIVSKDKGVTWAVQGAAVDAIRGPFFGQDEKHIVVMGARAIYESTDAGASWNEALKLATVEQLFLKPGQVKGRQCNVYWFESLAWDPIHDLFLHSYMGAPARKYAR